MASARLVSKLNLETKPQPQPYKLQWLSEDGEMTMNKQVEVGFSIGKQDDFVLCDVVPMEACHVLLGRPWKFDKMDKYDRFVNKFSFVYKEHKITLAPLSPRVVCENQNKMREKRKQERKEREKLRN